MPKGIWKDATPRECPICREEYTPVRKVQVTCKKCRYTSRGLAYKAHLREEEDRPFDLKPRPCEKCKTVYVPIRPDQRTCGTDCPGRPDYVRECANPRCELPERDEHDWHLLPKQFVIKGNSRGKGNQAYCSRSCREINAPWRLAERFRRYGVTPEQYQEMVTAQENRCMICGEPPSPPPRQNWREGDWDLAVDHDHKTDELRDLLCHRHNQGIGLFDDNPTWLRAAADYIEQHRNRTCPQHWHKSFTKAANPKPNTRKARRLPPPA